jgi:hypothetical protein
MHTKDKKNPDMLHMGYFMPLASQLNHGACDTFGRLLKQSMLGRVTKVRPGDRAG